MSAQNAGSVSVRALARTINPFVRGVYTEQPPFDQEPSTQSIKHLGDMDLNAKGE